MEPELHLVNKKTRRRLGIVVFTGHRQNKMQSKKKNAEYRNPNKTIKSTRKIKKKMHNIHEICNICIVIWFIFNMNF